MLVPAAMLTVVLLTADPGTALPTARPGAAPQPSGQAAQTPMQPRAAVERLTEQLRAAIGDSDTRRRDRTLVGLRALRDGEMAALFAQLSINPSTLLRVHGLLGLAELEPRRGLDLLGVSRIPDQRLQGVVIYDALSSNLIGGDALPELSSWPWLPARVRLDLAGVCLSRGRPFDAEGVKRLLDDQDPFNAMAAGAVLEHAGIEPAAARRALRSRAGGLAAAAPLQAADFAAFITEHNLRGGGAALELLAVGIRAGPEQDAVLAAHLVAAPAEPGASRRARARLDASVPAADRRAFSLRLLDAALRLRQGMPREVVGEMAADPDPSVQAMGRAAAALVLDQEGVGRETAVLARSAEPALVDWALRCASERHWQDARLIRAAVLEGVASRPGAGPVDPRHAAAATLAATDLADDDPRSLDRPLAEALSKGDAALVQIILEGVLRSIHPDAGSLVRQGRFEPRPAGPWPDARAAATALLVAARHGEFTADPAERIARLSAIASAGPGSGISAVLRAQAAWLALRVSGEDRVALTRILNDLSAPPADTPQPGPQPKPPPADAATPAPSRP